MSTLTKHVTDWQAGALAAERGDEPFTEGCTAGFADADAAPQDVGSDEPQPGMETTDAMKLLDLMEAERQNLLRDPRIADAKVKLLAVADKGVRSVMFGVNIWLHQPRRCFYGEGTSLADATFDALLAASPAHELAKRAEKGAVANG